MKWAARTGHAMIINVKKACRGAHTVYRLAYHFVWTPRYRRKVLSGDVAQRGVDHVLGLVSRVGEYVYTPLHRLSRSDSQTSEVLENDSASQRHLKSTLFRLQDRV